ncbi:MAG: hypothetical protein KatS3mg115_2424 [Candidatus Poribacteria bacterium]|nr:MAG: hypothetical protein KatS3mg115_2424 [Candidatus Poribacteria bacterium]
MRLAYSRPGGEETLRAMLERLHEEGFQALQLKGPQYLGWVDRPPEEFRERYRSGEVMGLVVYEEDLERIARTVRFMKAVGIPIISWVPNWQRGVVYPALAVDRLERVGQLAQRYGVRLTLHNHRGTVFQDDLDLEVFRLLVRSEYAAVTLDTAHFWLAGVRDIGRAIREYSELIEVVHLKDVSGEEFCPLGEGELPFREVFQALEAVGFRGWLVVDDEATEVPVETAMSHARRFLERYLPAS